MRHVLIDLKSGLVENVVEIVDGDGSVAPKGFLHVASETAEIGDTWDGSKIVPAPLAAPTWGERQQQARAALSASDYIAMRCMKAGVDYPQAWRDYDNKLRAILRAEDGDAGPGLPQSPAPPDYNGGI